MAEVTPGYGESVPTFLFQLPLRLGVLAFKSLRPPGDAAHHRKRIERRDVAPDLGFTPGQMARMALCYQATSTPRLPERSVVGRVGV